MFLDKNPFTGDLVLIKDQSAIQQAFKNIILTSPGERPLEYFFGTDIYNIVFEHPQLIQFYAESSINPSVNKNEPRVRIENMSFNTREKEIDINIEYVIPSLNLRDKVTITLQRTR
jgi:phage baseplate assembly protein W